MTNILLFDDPAIRGSLLPFTFTRPVADIRVGILKISEKWKMLTGAQISFLTQEYLQKKFPRTEEKALAVNGAWLPDAYSLRIISLLRTDEVLYFGKTILAGYIGETEKNLSTLADKKAVQLEQEPVLLQKTWQIFQFNGAEIRKDYTLLTKGRTSQPVHDPHTVVYGSNQIFIEEGAKIKAAVLNAESGPIYIGKNTEIQEGSLIRGPFALCEGSTVNMGAKLRGDTTVGPFSKIGGEVSNSVIFGYSNKGHEGFLGNSVIGEWCNLGADTNTSNLKNNYAPVKLWDYTKGGFSNTGLQFCGLMMGDHSKCGINTMFNTGTVVGVGANIFGDGYPRNFIPSFSWGGAAGFSTFTMPKFEETAIAVYGRRGVEWTPVEKEILDKVFELTKSYRIWDKTS
ncbi:UDP-N-acetylglucosamine diphosphorylase/glucosamine-1-phosphate N-acetyltransferase [Algoriphagus aquaeductus]|uniref:UDP-N-acetylglucosamine diphosphorylase/glucosamine-1-phosphate N-acetyltransferase n=1 Tax=Algoriphagus aquaeductus TaxID=475299 RepID=A0A326RT19_9BACT|nr:GlmU family protein [Algoriphagus aquaeductus]PZV84666.1 UDP-N-acetylglucosamine diphosphorylase/glucosamine-1-phosphate N-acetyltransferase [Algoriphagus aquaeductus]